jgi:histone acetyltransferase (RNA polymerase elongator complex component)
MNARPFIVPVLIPNAGCPHRCVFCNQAAITGRGGALPESGDWRTRVREFLRFRGRRQGISQIAFFGGNFLGLHEDRILAMLTGASEYIRKKELNGIRFSTRPDTVNRKTLGLLSAFPVQTVELGAQSMDETVLKLSRRGHTAADTAAAVEMLKDAGYKVGLQVMAGLPGDDAARLMETGRRIVELKPDFVRIYPTVVLAESMLETWYHAGRYQPLETEAAVKQTMPLYRLFRQQGIPVIRTGLQPTEELTTGGAVVAGPFHPAFGHLVQSACFLDAARNALRRMSVSGQLLEIRVHPRSLSRMRGMKNENCEALKQEFGFSEVDVLPDAEIQEEETIEFPDGSIVPVYGPDTCASVCQASGPIAPCRPRQAV